MATLSSLMDSVQQLKGHVDSFNLDLAREEAERLYKEGSDWVVRIIKGEQLPNPLPITLRLVQILSLPDIQLENDLRYQVAKACRLFTECFAWQAFDDGHIVYGETKKQLIDCFEKILGALPKREVAMCYELKSAREATKTLATDESDIKKYGFGLAKALFNRSILDVSGLFLKAWKERPESWAWNVFVLNLTSRIVLQKEKGYELDLFYEKIASYQDVPMVAFGALETVAPLFTQSLDEKRFRDPLLQGESLPKPGILTLANLPGSDFWEIRYRAVEHLRSLCYRENPSKIILQALAHRIDEEDKEIVIKLLKQVNIQLKPNPDWVDLMKFFPQKTRAKIEALSQSHQRLKEKIKTQVPKKEPVCLLQGNTSEDFLGDDDTDYDSSFDERNKLEQELKLVQEKLQLEQERLEYFTIS